MAIDKRSVEGLSTISRVQVIDGFAIPGIIHNGDYHFTDFQVYSDGLVDCWDMVDLALFQHKLNSGWVVTSVPDNGLCSVFQLGRWKVAQGEWIHDKASFYHYVQNLVKKLNPELANLYNCHGTTTKVIDGVNVSVFSSHNSKPYYISKPHRIFPERTHGKSFSFFFNHFDKQTYLVSLLLFPDGHVELSGLPEKLEFNIDELPELITQRKLFTDLAPDERVHVFNLGSFKTIDGYFVPVEEKYKEILDEYRSMKGEETSIECCQRVLAAYRISATRTLKEELKKAYESIPLHNRRFVGDMDVKDTEVRMIIYGEQEIEHWSHYQAAKEFGYELPTINIPKLPDDSDDMSS